MNEPPRIENWQPDVSRTASRRTTQIRNVITPSEAFKRGFYGGLGLWCSFMVLNLVAALIGVMLLVALGVLGSAV